MVSAVKTLVAVILAIAYLCSPASAVSPLAPEMAGQAGDVLAVALKCKFSNGQLVCRNNTQSDRGDNPKKKPGKKVDPNTCGEQVNCEAGLVRLEKPNRYGACCEAREGLPAPKAAESEACKFPGEIGTPPNCSCPAGTEFLGYKGCVKTSSWGCMADVAGGGDVTMFLTAPSKAGAELIYTSRLKAELNKTPSGPIDCTLR